jgi:hypothetical protein
MSLLYLLGILVQSQQIACLGRSARRDVMTAVSSMLNRPAQDEAAKNDCQIGTSPTEPLQVPTSPT